MQQNPADRGLVPKSGYHYKSGIWAKDLSAVVSFSEAWIPFMSGYGGITVAMLPNNTVYYYFSDNDEFVWMIGARF